MLFLQTEIFLFTFCIIDFIQTEVSPDGENVCLQTETYKEITTIKILKPKIVKSTRWCWKFWYSFRCDKTVTKWNYENEPRVFNRTRIVPKCCNGYREEKEHATKCVPVCLKECLNGKCVAPETCSCKPGYHGLNCAETCPRGFWGENCHNKCECSGKGECEKAYGVCHCQPGWSGDKCEFPCQSGYYGFSCMNKCSCNGQPCDHISGECMASTTVKKSFAEIFTEIDQSTLYGTSTTELFEAGFTEDFANKTKEETTALTDTTISDSIEGNEMNFLENTKLNEDIADEAVSKDLTSSLTESYADVSAKAKILMKVLRPNEPKTEDVYLKLNKTDFQDSLETFTENSDLEETKVTSEAEKILEFKTSSESNKNKTTVRNFGSTDQNEYNNGTENYISGRHGGSGEQTIPTFFQFLPTFAVLSGVSLIIFITAAGRIIVIYQRKTKIIMTAETHKDEVFQMDEKVKHQTEDFCVNYCAKSFAHLSDADLKNKTPVLRTFKPEIADKSLISKEKKI